MFDSNLMKIKRIPPSELWDDICSLYKWNVTMETASVFHKQMYPLLLRFDT
jgi:hypothetical protein